MIVSLKKYSCESLVGSKYNLERFSGSNNQSKYILRNQNLEGKIHKSFKCKLD